MNCLLTTSLALLALAEIAPAAEPPYPPSPVIAGIEWAPAGEIVRLAPGGDNWPLTWADDDALYTLDHQLHRPIRASRHTLHHRFGANTEEVLEAGCLNGRVALGHDDQFLVLTGEHGLNGSYRRRTADR